VWDVAYDGYCGGKDLTVMQWDAEGMAEFQEACQKTSRNFVGKSIVCVPYGDFVHVTSPIPMCCAGDNAGAVLATSDLILRDVNIKDAAAGALSGETTTCRIMYEGTSAWSYHPSYARHATSAVGRGHHAGDAMGMPRVRG